LLTEDKYSRIEMDRGEQLGRRLSFLYSKATEEEQEEEEEEEEDEDQRENLSISVPSQTFTLCRG
jgi:hypothetical protein